MQPLEIFKQMENGVFIRMAVLKNVLEQTEGETFMKTVIKNGVLLDNQNSFKKADIEIEGKVITKIGENLETENCNVVDAGGLLITPGLVDLHVHLREPGGEHKGNNRKRDACSGKRRFHYGSGDA